MFMNLITFLIKILLFVILRDILKLDVERKKEFNLDHTILINEKCELTVLGRLFIFCKQFWIFVKNKVISLIQYVKSLTWIVILDNYLINSKDALLDELLCKLDPVKKPVL